MAENSSGEIVGTFLAGTIIGGIVALLLAPSSGKQTREKLGDWMSEGKDKAQQKIDELEEEIRRRKEELLKEIKRQEAEWRAKREGSKVSAEEAEVKEEKTDCCGESCKEEKADWYAYEDSAAKETPKE